MTFGTAGGTAGKICPRCSCYIDRGYVHGWPCNQGQSAGSTSEPVYVSSAQPAFTVTIGGAASANIVEAVRHLQAAETELLQLTLSKPRENALRSIQRAGELL